MEGGVGLGGSVDGLTTAIGEMEIRLRFRSRMRIGWCMIWAAWHLVLVS